MLHMSHLNRFFPSRVPWICLERKCYKLNNYQNGFFFSWMFCVCLCKHCFVAKVISQSVQLNSFIPRKGIFSHDLFSTPFNCLVWCLSFLEIIVVNFLILLSLIVWNLHFSFFCCMLWCISAEICQHKLGISNFELKLSFKKCEYVILLTTLLGF